MDLLVCMSQIKFKVDYNWNPTFTAVFTMDADVNDLLWPQAQTSSCVV